MYRKHIFLLIFTIILAGMFRWYYLGIVPAGLHVDEAQVGYNAYTLSQSGKTVTGDRWPLYFDTWADYRPAGIVYLTLPFVKLFGLSIFTTRFPLAAVSVCLVFLAFLFAKLIFKSNKISLLSALFVAVSPYSLILSRTTFEGVLETAVVILSLLMLIYGFKLRKPWLIFASYPLLVLSYFSYMTSRMLTPLFWIVTSLFCYWEFRPSKRYLVYSLLPLVVYTIFPWFYFFRSQVGMARFNQVNIFANPDVARTIREGILQDGGAGVGILLSRLFHNKPAAYIGDVCMRYLTFFSPNPLLFFIHQPDRYFVPNIGPITLLEYTGFIYSLGLLLARRMTKPFYYLWALFLLAPLPSALTSEAFPNFSRVVYFVPLWQIVASYGLWRLFYLLRVKHLLQTAVICLISGIFVYQITLFLHQYLIHQPQNYYAIASRTTEMPDLVRFMKQQRDLGKTLLSSEYNGTYIYYLFFNQLNVFNLPVSKPTKYYSKNFSLDKTDYIFSECIGPKELAAHPNAEVLIIRAGCQVPSWMTPVAKFYRSDKSVADVAYEINPTLAAGYYSYLRLLNQPGIDPKNAANKIAKEFIIQVN